MVTLKSGWQVKSSVAEAGVLKGIRQMERLSSYAPHLSDGLTNGSPALESSGSQGTQGG